MSIRKHHHRAATEWPSETYEVGYGKPPTAFRFKKGVSGNPTGRPPRRPASEPTLASAKKPPDVRSPDVSDEQLLRLVKARKLIWQALFDLRDDRRAPEAKLKVPKRRGSSASRTS